jgi:hypothetical protein
MVRQVRRSPGNNVRPRQRGKRRWVRDERGGSVQQSGQHTLHRYRRPRPVNETSVNETSVGWSAFASTISSLPASTIKAHSRVKVYLWRARKDVSPAENALTTMPVSKGQKSKGI